MSRLPLFPESRGININMPAIETTYVHPHFNG